MLALQLVDLHRVQSAEREHPVLIEQERKVMFGGGSLHRCDEGHTQLADPIPHVVEFLLPQCGQFGILQNRRDDRCSMAGWIAVIAPYQPFELAEHRRCGLRMLGNHGDRSHPLAVQSEVLREGIADDHFAACGQDLPKSRGVLGQSPPKTLIGEIDDGQQSMLGQRAGDLPPLLGIRIDASGVVATSMQQDRVPWFGFGLQVFQHARRIESPFVISQVAIRFRRDPRGGKDRLVVGPGGVGHPDPQQPELIVQEVSGDAERPRPSGRLRDRDTVQIDRFPKHQPSDMLPVDLESFDRQISLRRFVLDKLTFGLLDAVQHRRPPRGVLVNTAAEVHFVRAGIGIVGLHEPQDRIGGGRGNGAESMSRVDVRGRGHGVRSEGRNGDGARGHLDVSRPFGNRPLTTTRH